ncbi:MAG: helix-turn-helix domain-containing protein [Bacteroidetes bacterium]|nr:MAG: helix-turn-helix domain-containing protein [Bacteroidota bacterium]
MSTDLKKELGSVIRTRRKELRIKQKDLAILAQINPNTLGKIEQGQGNPTLEVLGKLFDVLGLTLQISVKVL